LSAKLDISPQRGVSATYHRGLAAPVAVSTVTRKSSAVDFIRTTAARRIQKFWRKRRASKKPFGGVARGGSVGVRPSRRGSGAAGTVASQAGWKYRFRPVHFAASRIQRAWKLQRWRRMFTEFSENQLGWVGSLAWLQQHNLLYGTELADTEDVRWWLQQRSSAPLDREVDPWGSDRLLEHLNRMWYGVSPGESQAQNQLQQNQRAYYEKDGYAEERCEDIYSTFAGLSHEAHMQSASKYAGGSRRSGAAALAVSSGVTASVRTFTSPGRASAGGHRQVSVASVTGNAASALTAASFSPRHEPAMIQASGEGAVRQTGAPLPSTYPRGYRVASHSPPQTHRVARATIPATPSSLLSLRPNSPGSARATNATPASSRLSLGNSNTQPRSLGLQRPSSSMNRAISGSPPPSVMGRSPVASRR